jgi:Archaeal holliday junction resolvase (hjc)
MTPEGRVKSEVRKILRENAPDVHYIHVPGSQYGKAGAPDYIACVCGWFIAIECKAGKNGQTWLQKEAQTDIEKAWGIYLLINEKNYDLLRNTIEVIRAKENIQ